MCCASHIVRHLSHIVRHIIHVVVCRFPHMMCSTLFILYPMLCVISCVSYVVRSSLCTLCCTSHVVLSLLCAPVLFCASCVVRPILCDICPTLCVIQSTLLYAVPPHYVFYIVHPVSNVVCHVLCILYCAFVVVHSVWYVPHHALLVVRPHYVHHDVHLSSYTPRCSWRQRGREGRIGGKEE